MNFVANYRSSKVGLRSTVVLKRDNSIIVNSTRLDFTNGEIDSRN